METDYDVVHVYDGPTTEAPLLGKVTGGQGKSFNSSRRHMTVVFSSDDNWTQQGFHAEWTFLGMFQFHLFLIVGVFFGFVCCFFAWSEVRSKGQRMFPLWRGRACAAGAITSLV